MITDKCVLSARRAGSSPPPLRRQTIWILFLIGWILIERFLQDDDYFDWMHIELSPEGGFELHLFVSLPGSFKFLISLDGLKHLRVVPKNPPIAIGFRPEENLTPN